MLKLFRATIVFLARRALREASREGATGTYAAD